MVFSALLQFLPFFNCNARTLYISCTYVLNALCMIVVIYSNNNNTTTTTTSTTTTTINNNNNKQLSVTL